MAYDAFISYSHAADGRLAPALQAGLQRLARPWHRRWALRVFRDETGLAVNPHLWASIATALDDSAHFVLLASPEAAASPWVNREIEHFFTKDPHRPILPVLTDGTLVWDNARRGYDPLASSALPAALAGRFVDEPRHLDLRWARDETHLDLRHSRFREAVADLAAPMHHLPKDELESEDIRRHRRALRLARAAVVVLTVLLLAAAITGGLAVQNARRADKTADELRAEATATLSRQLAASSTNALNDGRIDLALALAVAANDAQTNIQTRSSLVGALLAQPTLRKYLHGLNGAARPMAFNASGRLLAVSDLHKARVWNVSSGQLLAHQPADLTSNAFVRSHELSADGSTLAAAVDVDPGPSEKHSVTVWDLRTGRILRTFARAAGDETVTLSPDGSTLAVGGAGETQLWNVKSGSRVRSLPFGAAALAFSPDGTVLAGATTVAVAPRQIQPVIRRWDVATGAERGAPIQAEAYECGAPQPGALDTCELAVLQIAFSSDGTHLLATARDISRDIASNGLVGGPDRSIIHWGDEAGTPIAVRGRITTSDSEPLVAVSPDGKFAATRSRVDGAVQVRDATNGAPIGERLSAPSVGGRSVSPAIFSPDGATIAVGGTDGLVRLYDTQPTRPRLGRSLPVDLTSVRALALAPDGRTLAVGRDDGTLTLVALHTGRSLGGQPLGRVPGLVTVEFTDDGRLLAAVDEIGAVRVWAAKPAQHRSESVDLKPPCSRAGLPSFVSADGRTVLFQCPQHFTAWDVAQQKTKGEWSLPRGSPTDFSVDAVALSPDGRVLALRVWHGVGAPVDVRLADAKSGKRIGPELDAGPTELGYLDFSPDGSTLASAGNEGILLWNLATGRRTAPRIQGGAPQAQVLAFSPDAKLVASGASDGSVQLWDVGTASRLGGRLRGTAPVGFLAFGPNGRTLISGEGFGMKGTLIEWDLDEASWTRTACEIVNRNLTREEWTFHAGSSAPYRRACDPVV